MKRIGRALLAMVIVTVALVGSGQTADAAGPVWWNASYTHRLAINVFANDAITSGYSLDVVINHAAMVAEGSSLSSGDDLRIARYDGSSWSELDRVLAVGSSWNDASTKVVFKTQTAIAQTTNDASYWLYYGNGGAINPPANANNVYTLFDDFSSPTLDTTKWCSCGLSQPGVSLAPVNGQLQISGTKTGTGQIEGWTGMYSKAGFGSNFETAVTFSAVTQTTDIQANWKAMLGFYEQTFANGWPGGPSRVINNWYQSPNPVSTFGNSTLTSQTFSDQRIRITRTNAAARMYEGNTLVATNPAPNGNYEFWLAYNPGKNNEAFDVRFDDVVVRKFVALEPKVTVEQPRDIAFSTAVAPIFSFTVAGRTADCNDVPLTAPSTASSLDLGSLNSSRTTTAGQDLTFVSNARLGYLMQVRITGPMANQSGRALANMPGTRSSPLAAPGAGTEAFGYTVFYAASTSGSKFASFKTVPESLVSGANMSVGKCIAVQASASPNTPPGAYTTTIVYTAIPTF